MSTPYVDAFKSLRWNCNVSGDNLWVHQFEWQRSYRIQVINCYYKMQIIATSGLSLSGQLHTHKVYTVCSCLQKLGTHRTLPQGAELGSTQGWWISQCQTVQKQSWWRLLFCLTFSACWSQSNSMQFHLTEIVKQRWMWFALHTSLALFFRSVDAGWAGQKGGESKTFMRLYATLTLDEE